MEQQNEQTEKELAGLIQEYKAAAKPLRFWPHDKKNTGVKFAKHFERMFAILEEAGTKDPKELTVFEFYNRLEYLKEKADEANKTVKKR